MSAFTVILLFIIGLCWGSFINVLILRTISHESIITPLSKCPHCGSQLLNWQKIPIVSYIILKGRCYFCNQKISLQYPIMELVGAAIVLFSFITNVSKLDAISAVMILSMFLVMAATDIVSKKICPTQAYTAIIFALLLNRHDIFNSILGGVFAAVLVVIVMKLFYRFLHTNPLGEGEIYLIGALGFIVGLDKIILYLIYALLIQFVIVIPKYIKSLLVSKNYETLKYLIFFTISCVFLYFLKKAEFFGANLVIAVLLLGLLFCAFKLSKNLINSVKTPEITSYVPFAPAIAMTCLIFFC